jgi:hypothetical protein
MSRSAIAMMTFGLAVALGTSPCGALTSPLRREPSGHAEGQADAQQHRPPAVEMSRAETPGKAFARQWRDQEYEVRSAAEAMPADKWDYRPGAGLFKNEELKFDPTEVRTFAEQVRHVACSNFAFAAELDGNTPPEACYNGGPSPAHTRTELLVYLRDSFVALRTSLSAITAKNMYDPIEGPYAGPNTRIGLAAVCVWHAADHYGQMALYLRLNGIVPPASRPSPPKLKDSPEQFSR